MAPHLDGVHVVFGLIISGFEVIKKIEGLKTDSASRPYADVRVVDCGQLITKSANDVLEGKRKRTSPSTDSLLNSPDSSSRFSSLEFESESDEPPRNRKRKRRAKSRRSKKRRKESKKENIDVVQLVQSPVEGPIVEGQDEVEEEKEHSGKREKPVVRPEEIPPVPENRFLLRRDMPSQEEKTETVEKEESSLPADQKPAVSKSGRKIKGRGTMRYHTPTRSKSRSASVEERGSSETPPHWKEEMKRTKVYHPPSVERWSKGDKLNDRSSSRWQDRGDSAWSRSPSAERSSGRSPERISPCPQEKKAKKKSKHKKKAKKRKHGKKKSSKNKAQETCPPEPETSVSPERKSRKSHSPTRSSSSRRPSSAQRRRRRQSSLSSRDSRSYSRSYTASRSRSLRESYSRSRSPTRSRSRSPSRSSSRSRSRSRYRSLTLTPSRKRSFSRSPRRRNAGKTKADLTVRVTDKLPDTTVLPAPRLPPAPAPESAPVIPMSDSPPPSRWKPGQKPWKPSYFHNPEVKAKLSAGAAFPTGPAGECAEGKAPTPVAAKSPPQDSESFSANRTAGALRSRSDSSSRSRSRSGSSSRSASRSPRRHRGGLSSRSRSDSDESQRAKKNLLYEGWREHQRSLARAKPSNRFVTLSRDASSGSENAAGKSHTPNFAVSGEKIKERAGSQDQDAKHSAKHSVPVECFKSRTEWDSDSDKASQCNSNAPSANQKPTALPSEVPDKKLSAHAGWNSESDSENTTARALAAYEKEEGEASSESDYDASRKWKGAAEQEAAVPVTSRLSEENHKETTEPEKHKSKKKSKRKHKRKRCGKSGSQRAKDKRKRSARKRQRPKETFHWQPPLEFGDEEDEDETKKEKRTPNGAAKERPGADAGAKGEEQKAPNKNQSRGADEAPHRPKECASKGQKQGERHQSSSRNHCTSAKEESLDDMDICTPEHEVEIEEPPAVAKASNSANKSSSKPSDAASRDAALPHRREEPAAARASAGGGRPLEASGGSILNFKWRPLEGMLALASANWTPAAATRGAQARQAPNRDAQAVRMEIKSKSRVRPGSLFDEVRKTARLNQRPRNQESSSGEESSPDAGQSKGAPRARSPKKSRKSRSRGWSQSSSRSRSRSRSSSYSSRSRSRSRRPRRRGRSRSRSSTSRSSRSPSSAYSRSHSRSRSYVRRRRCRSDTYDSYSSRSRSVSRRRGRRRSHSSRSSERRSRSSRSSSRSSSGRRSHSGSSRYS